MSSLVEKLVRITTHTEESELSLYVYRYKEFVLVGRCIQINTEFNKVIIKL